MQSSSSGRQCPVEPMIYLTGGLVGCLILATISSSIFLPVTAVVLVLDIVYLFRYLSCRRREKQADQLTSDMEPAPPEEPEETEPEATEDLELFEESEEVETGPVSSRMEIGISCPRCESFLPLNGPILNAHCRSCQSDIEIPRSYWKDILGDAMEDVRELEKGTGTSSRIFGQFQSSNVYARLDPYCLECKTDFEDPWSLSPGSSYCCRECGAEYPIQDAPEWLSAAFPQIIYLLNAELDGTDAEDMNRDSTNPVVFTCPQCGGALKVTGEDRLVHCRYCDADVYLPDDLWLRLHPAKKKERWFVVYG